MSGICTNSGLAFQANNFIPDANITNPGNNYGCLASTPNPAWYYLEISQPGNLLMTLTAAQDIDFIMWGPFPNLANAIANCNTYSAADIVPNIPGLQQGCSYSFQSIESPSIANALVGEVYVLLVTNYASVVQNITLVQSGGTSGTDCNVLNPPQCDIISISADVISCDSLSPTYNLSGVIEFNNAPLFGSLIVKNCSGDSVIYNPPFISPLNYNINDIPNSGNQNCTINTYFFNDNSCNLSTDSIIVSWYDLPNVEFSSDIIIGCKPLEVYFNNTTDVTQVASCDWDLGNGFNSNNLDTVVTIYNTPGSYPITLEVTNSDGCVNDTTYTNYINVYDNPIAGFTSSPNPVSILTPAVQFVDTSSSDVVYFDWTFYDSTNTMIGSDYVQNPIYNFSGIIAQQYYIQLYVENQNGCSDTVYGTQIVEGEYSLFIPNVFTPNGDGINDSFFPIGDKIENYSFKIFNRWGGLIFSTNDLNEKWDGMYQNKPLSSGSYVWKIDLINSSSGEESNLKGHVLLTR
tara:strand:- start:189 stop:1742 length:1554 start_codon:yes stop_codon:yes gene_type:complete